ncbi:hypothetical protein H9P43_005234 [Blastocladiella emersonii ATCC 22665]|nr:hypothetical protein H9P43_005234 [Blastocladiella emersonii ATCC 22665]
MPSRTPVVTSRKKRIVTVTVRKLSHAVAPALGLGPLIPQLASIPGYFAKRGPPAPIFMHKVALATLSDMYAVADGSSKSAAAMPLALAGVAEEDYARYCKEPYPAMEWEGDSDALAEYLAFCRTAMVDRRVVDTVMSLESEPTPKVIGSMSARFALDGRLEHAVLLPLFPN